jgi:uncharacterized protein (DUF433 family)
MTTLNRITIDPKTMNGQPCIRGLRVTVKRLLSALASYPTRDELFREYPEIEEEDIKQALEYASRSVEDRIIPLSGMK